jgi:lipopolysaccharide export system permease protein
VTRFDRHIIARLVKGFLLFIAALIVFFIVLHYVEYSDDFFDGGATLRQVFLVYYPSYIPEIIRLTSPLALFLSSIYLTGKLAQELQITALQTSGVSLYRLMVPYLVVGVFVTGFMFWFNGWVVPQTNETVVEYDSQYLNQGSRQVDNDEIHRQNRPGSIVSVGFYDRTDQVAHQVSLQAFADSARLARRVDATRMRWVDSLGVWRLEDVTRRSFDEGDMRVNDGIAEVDTVLNIYPRDFARSGRDAEAMTIPAAADFVDALQRSGADNIGRTLVHYYNKYSYPFANLILVLISVPLASVRRRGGQAVQFGLGLGTAFVYLATQKLTEPFGYSGTLPPEVTAWLPHAVFAFIALVLIVRVRK